MGILLKLLIFSLNKKCGVSIFVTLFAIYVCKFDRYLGSIYVVFGTLYYFYFWIQWAIVLLKSFVSYDWQFEIQYASFAFLFYKNAGSIEKYI